MFQIPKNQLIDEWCGFTVYDAEDGHKLDYGDYMDFDHGNGLRLGVDPMFLLSDDGGLKVHNNCFIEDIPKEGKYIIQYGDGRYQRW